MQDRVPTPGKENRVRIRTDDGQTIEGVFEYADDASVQGSAYNKANVLPDDVCAALGIDTAVEPKDAFYALARSGNLEYDIVAIEVTDTSGSPVPGCYHSSEEFGDVVTNSLGIAIVKVITSAGVSQKTMQFKAPIDRGGTAFSVSFTPVKGSPIIVRKQVSVSAAVSKVTLTTSGKYTFSKTITANILLLSGGGGGYAAGLSNAYGLAFAVGGGCIEAESLSATIPLGVPVEVIIGAAGKGKTADSDATAGGKTQINFASTTAETKVGSAGAIETTILKSEGTEYTAECNTGKKNQASVTVTRIGEDSEAELTVSHSLSANAVITDQVTGTKYGNGGSICGGFYYNRFSGTTLNAKNNNNTVGGKIGNQTNGGNPTGFGGGGAAIINAGNINDIVGGNGSAGAVVIKW